MHFSGKMRPELPLLFVCSLVLSVFFTWLARLYAIKNKLIDIPNSRSSHVQATPTGGGIAIAMVFTLSCLLLYHLGLVSADILYTVLPAAATVTIIGFWDDHGHVPPLCRLIAHTASVSWIIFMTGLAIGVYMPAGIFYFEHAAAVAIGLFLVWFINLYNFMDGIDGIAICEAIFISAGGALIACRAGSVALLALHLILMSVCLGFLVWNWPPAKIFMGDAGSGFIGVALAALAYQSVHANGVTLWSWLILPAVFVSDTTITLVRRVLAGEAWYRSHRTHAYQKAAHKWGHKPVIIVVSLINIIWVAPMVYLAESYPSWGVAMAAIAYLPLGLYLLILPFENKQGEKSS